MGKQMKTMTSELDELNEVIKGLEEERDEHKSRASDQDGLQAEVDRLQGLLSSTEKALADASKSGEDSKAQAKALQGEIKDLLERLRAAEDAKTSMQLDAEKAKHANELLQKDLDHAQKQMKTMTSELDELNEVIKGLEEERDEIKAQRDEQRISLQAEIDRLQGVLMME